MSMWKRRSIISEMTRSTSARAMRIAFSGLSMPIWVWEEWVGRMAAWMAAAALLLFAFERNLFLCSRSVVSPLLLLLLLVFELLVVGEEFAGG